MKLYGYPASPHTWKVRAFAHHLGVPLRFELVDLLKGESRLPAYLAINPTGRAPTLADGDFKLGESAAIMLYLEDLAAKPDAAVDKRRRADIARWHSWQIAHWDASCRPLVFERLVKGMMGLGAPDPAVVARATEAFHAEAKMLDAHLSTKAYLTGSAPTSADFAAAGNLLYVTEGQIPVEGYPNIQRWRSAMMALPGWKATAPQG